MSEVKRAEVTGSELDAAIDAVAREMVTREPPPAFRTLVMERIGRRSGSGNPGRVGLTAPRGTWVAATVVLVLTVAAVVWIERGDIPPAPGTAASPTVAPTSPSNSPVGPARLSAGPSAIAGRETTMAARSAQSRRIAAPVRTASHAGAAGDYVEFVPALAELEALQLTNVGPDALDVPAVDVEPLPAIPSLDIPRLHSESIDTRSTDSKKEN